MKFYAFEFFSGRQTIWGDANARTGRCSKAGHLAVFTSRTARDAWVSRGKVTPGMGGNCREAVTAKEARSLCAGDSPAQFEERVSLAAEYYS